MAMDQQITLLSNLIEMEKKLDLETVFFVPSIQLQKEFNSQSRFCESHLVSAYKKELPNRPYTYDQGIMLRRRMHRVIKDLNELHICVETF